MTGFAGFLPSPPLQRRPKSDNELLLEDVTRSLQLGAWTPDIPQHRTLRELARAYNYTPDPDISFGGKLYNALAEETVLGQSFGDLFGPSFAATGYYPTAEDKEYFASDLPPEMVERVADETDSFEEFLYELDQLRLTLKRRQELYSGGFGGAAVGMGLTFLAAGGEAVAAGLLTTALIPGIGALGGNIASNSARAARIVGAAKAAGVSLAVDVPLEVARYRLDKSLTTNDLLIALSASGILSAGVGAWKPHLYVDKLKDAAEDAAKSEAAALARAAGDEDGAKAIEATITRREVRPRSILTDINKLREELAKLSDEEIVRRAKLNDISTTAKNPRRTLEKALEDTESKKLEAALLGYKGVKSKNKIAALDKEVAERTKKLLEDAEFGFEVVGEIYRKAGRYFPSGQRSLEDIKLNEQGFQGIDIKRFAPTRTKTRGELEFALEAAEKSRVRSRSAGAMREAQDAAAAHINRYWDGLSDAQKRATAKAMGLSGDEINKLGPRALKKATIQAARKATAKGSIRISTVSRPTRIKATGAKLKYPAKTVKVFKRTVELKGNLEKMLFKMATSKKQEVIDTIADHLKERGIKEPMKLAREFMSELKQQVGNQPRNKILVGDASTMELPSAVRVLETGSEFRPKVGQGLFEREVPFTMKVDEDLFPGTNVKKSDPKLTADDKAELETKPVDEADEIELVGPNGEPLVVGDISFMDVDGEAIVKQASDQGNRTGHGKGHKETVVRSINQLGAADPTGWFGLKKIANIFFKAFTPTYFRMMRSNSALVRKMADAFMDNPMGYGVASADAVARLNFEKALSTLQKALREAKNMARKAGETYDSAEVIRALRAGGDFEGHVGYAVSHLRGFFRSILDHAKEAGVFVDQVTDWNTYFPRRWNPAKFQQVVEKLGEGNKAKGVAKVEELLTESIMAAPLSGGQGMTKGAARVAARSIINFIDHPEVTRTQASQLKYLDTIRKEISNELQRLNETNIEVDDILEVIIPHFESQPHLSHARRRIAMNENFSTVMDGVEVRVDDLMEMNLDLLVAQYAHKTLGAAAARQGMKAVFGNADLTIADVKERLIEDALKSGDSLKDANAFADMAEMAYKYTTGQPILQKQALKHAQVLNALAQGTIGMTLGFAQIPEIANIMFRNGFKAAWQQFQLSDVSNVFFMGLRGKRSGGAEMLRDVDDLSACIETYTGIGGDYHRLEHMLHRTDQLGFDDDFLTQTKWGRFLDAGRRFAALNPLGIMPMDTFMRRWASRAALQHFVNTAFDVGSDGVVQLSKSWWSNSTERFAQLGLNGDDIQRLSKVLKEPGRIVIEPGSYGNRVKHFNFEGVEDQAIVDKFFIALRRSTDSAIQRQSFGELPAWTNTVLGKLLGQFRVFSVAAKSKQLAAGVARGDAREIGNIVGGSGLAMLGYLMQTYYRALGRPDSEEYWAERTQADQLFKSAAMRNSYANIIPMFTDLVSTAFTGKGVFDESMRTTGLGLDPLHGSTAYSTVFRGLVPAIGGTVQAALRPDHDLTQADIRNIQSVVWLTKIPGIDQMLNRFFVPQFPESNR